jgi:xanthine dehydrogenase molybdopterin-binding subunit B
MQHIAKVVKKDPVQVRLTNMSSDDNVTPQMVKDLKVSADYDARKESVDEFYQESCCFLFYYIRAIYQAL